MSSAHKNGVKKVREFNSIEGRFHESLTWVECPESVEEGYKYDKDTGEFVEPEKTTPELSEAKADRIDRIKKRAKRVLSETDWYVVRKQETGKSIPQSVIDHRAKVRSLSDQFESDVNNFSSVSEVLDYSFSYPDPPEP